MTTQPVLGHHPRPADSHRQLEEARSGLPRGAWAFPPGFGPGKPLSASWAPELGGDALLLEATRTMGPCHSGRGKHIQGSVPGRWCCCNKYPKLRKGL